MAQITVFVIPAQSRRSRVWRGRNRASFSKLRTQRQISDLSTVGAWFACSDYPTLRQVALRDVLRLGGTFLSAQGDLTRSKKIRTSKSLTHSSCSASLDIGGFELLGCSTTSNGRRVTFRASVCPSHQSIKCPRGTRPDATWTRHPRAGGDPGFASTSCHLGNPQCTHFILNGLYHPS